MNNSQIEGRAIQHVIQRVEARGSGWTASKVSGQPYDLLVTAPDGSLTYVELKSSATNAFSRDHWSGLEEGQYWTAKLLPKLGQPYEVILVQNVDDMDLIEDRRIRGRLLEHLLKGARPHSTWTVSIPGAMYSAAPPI